MDRSPFFISTPITSRRAALLLSGRGEAVLCDRTHNMIRLLNVYKSNYQLIIIRRESFCHCNCYVMVIIEVINQSFVCYLWFFSKNERWLERIYARIGAYILYWLAMCVWLCAQGLLGMYTSSNNGISAIMLLCVWFHAQRWVGNMFCSCCGHFNPHLDCINARMF